MSFRTPAPLPDDVIDRLFSALTVRYGVTFTDRWRDLDLVVVKGDWARELAGFRDNLGAIRYALDHLTEKPPTVIDFRKLCNGAPWVSAQPMLPNNAPVRGPNELERVMLADLRESFRQPRKLGRQWAYELIQCHEAGWRNGKAFRSTPTALRMARDAIATDPDRPSAAADFEDQRVAA